MKASCARAAHLSSPSARTVYPAGGMESGIWLGKEPAAHMFRQELRARVSAPGQELSLWISSSALTQMINSCLAIFFRLRKFLLGDIQHLGDQFRTVI